MDVRPAQPEDLEAVVALWEHTGLTRPWNDPHDDFHRARECGQSELLVGVQDGRVCGSAVLGDDGHRGWIYLVAIDPSLQGSGAGRELVRASEDWFRQRGQLTLRLMVRNENSAVVGFYEALGYVDQDLFVLGRTLEQ